MYIIILYLYLCVYHISLSFQDSHEWCWEVKPSTSTWGAGKNRQLVPGPWTFPSERGRSHQPLGVWESQMIHLWSFYSKPLMCIQHICLICVLYIYITIHTHIYAHIYIYAYMRMLVIFHPSFFWTFQPAQTFPDPACTACRLQRSHPHGQHDFQAAWLGRRNESWDTFGILWISGVSEWVSEYVQSGIKWHDIWWHGIFDHIRM